MMTNYFTRDFSSITSLNDRDETFLPYSQPNLHQLLLRSLHVTNTTSKTPLESSPYQTELVSQPHHKPTHSTHWISTKTSHHSTAPLLHINPNNHYNNHHPRHLDLLFFSRQKQPWPDHHCLSLPHSPSFLILSKLARINLLLTHSRINRLLTYSKIFLFIKHHHLVIHILSHRLHQNNI